METNKGTSTKQNSSILNDFEKKVAEESASTVFQLVWGIIEKSGKHEWERIKVQRAIRTYTKNYWARHGAIKILGMPQPIPLHRIYTAVRVVNPQFLYRFADTEAMEESFKTDRKHSPFHEQSTSTDGIVVANEHRLLTILGAPGAGKSTFLRRLGYEAMLVRSMEGSLGNDVAYISKYAHPRLPVLLELRRARQQRFDLVSSIAEELSTCQFPNSTHFVEDALSQGRFLILLDGLDEVPDDRLDEVINHVRDFVDRYAGRDTPDGNRFIVSCRTAHYKNCFQRFTDVVLADFDNAQIEQFANNWFSTTFAKEEDIGRRFYTMLSEPQNTSALELARTPLLLTFLCLTFGYGQELPPTRATLYRRALDILLREWSAEKRVHNEPAYQELNAELEVDMLAELAEELFRENRFFFNRRHVLTHIKDFMGRELKAPKSLDANQILDAIEIQQGLIVRRAQDAFSFSHLTIQEYLSAHRLWGEGESIWAPMVAKHLFDDRWTVVFELMAGMGRADPLLIAMSRQCEQELKAILQSLPEVRSIFEWSRRLSQSDDGNRIPNDKNRICFRIVLVTCALILARGLDRARGLEPQYLFKVNTDLIEALSQELGISIDLGTEKYASPVFKHAKGETIVFARVVFAGASSLCSQGSEVHKRLEAAAAILSSSRDMSILEFTNALQQVWHKIELPQPGVCWEIGNLVKYIRGVSLIIRCKKAAYRISSQVWDGILESMMNS